jgi:hypothetical protein
MKRTVIIFALALAGLFAMPLRAADSLNARLEAGQLGNIEPGKYSAGDNITFTLRRWNEKFLLQLTGDPEVYVLSAGQASLGGRVLKYDSGATAMHISGWGGMTLYTDDSPSGLPAMRLSDADLPPPMTTKLNDLKKAANDEAAHLEYVRGVKLAFTADWDRLAGSPSLWPIAFAAIEHAGRGIERFTANRQAMLAIHRVGTVRIAMGPGPALAFAGRTIVITFNADNGFMGLASSRAIARQLAVALSVPRAGE